jgi:hypothetical protein
LGACLQTGLLLLGSGWIIDNQEIWSRQVFDVVSGFSALPTVFLRVGMFSQSAFQNWGEHFTFSQLQLFFKLPHVFSMSCSVVLCFLFLHVWHCSAACVPNVWYFCSTLFLDCSCFKFCCHSCFPKKRFLLKNVFSPGLTDKFDGFDDDVDLLTLEVSHGPSIFAQFSW